MRFSANPRPKIVEIVMHSITELDIVYIRNGLDSAFYLNKSVSLFTANILDIYIHEIHNMFFYCFIGYYSRPIRLTIFNFVTCFYFNVNIS